MSVGGLPDFSKADHYAVFLAEFQKLVSGARWNMAEEP
jgi:hypothetical protein